MTTLTLTPSAITERVIGRSVRSGSGSLVRFRRPVYSSERGLIEVVAVDLIDATPEEYDEVERVHDEVGGVGGKFDWHAPGRPGLENYLFLSASLTKNQESAAELFRVAFEVERTD